MQEAQQTPGGLVGNGGVEDGHNEGVKGKETEQMNADIGLCGKDRFAARSKNGQQADEGQNHDESFGPEGAAGFVIVEEQLEVVVPGVDVKVILAGAVQIGGPEAKGIEDAGDMGEEGGIKGGGYQNGGG
ncbi:MAG: hypothetical protein BWY71_00618 [Planctomycetes bacterium ADurb.Bin412]|nr:MAG: hypothetical protein BWY71_00618 [Planctomycetes bacterium ADurb.Bin412]